jgi:hypothetical protein
VKRSPIRRKRPLIAARPKGGIGTPVGGSLSRTRPIRPKKRAPDETLRIYGPPERIRWVASLRCACGCGGTPCENAHTTNAGLSRKAGYDTIIPLTPKCHRRQTDKGWESIGLTRDEARAIAGDVQRMWERRHPEQTRKEL